MAGIVVPTAKQRDSPLETVVKGLQIAQSVYGIKNASDEADARQRKEAAAQAESERLAAGKFTPSERIDIQGKGMVFSDKPSAGATRVTNAETGVPEYVSKQMSPLVHSVGNTLQQYDPATGTWKTAATAPDKPKEDKSIEVSTNLRKEYDSHPTTKASGLLLSAHDKIEKAATKQNPSPATDMSLVYGYMKMLDPGSTVREGEYATAENARGVGDTVSNLYNRILKGERLTPEQRAQFLSESDGIMQTQLSLQLDQDHRFGSYAQRNGVDPGQVIDPSFAKAAQRLEARMNGRQAPVAAAPQQDINEIGLPGPKGTANAAPNGKPPGTVVNIQGKHFIVGADGNTLTELK